MEYDLEPPPPQSRRFSGTHRIITLFWAALWTLLMALVFSYVNSQNGGWLDGPEVAALIAGFGLVVGLGVLGLVAGIARLLVKDQVIRTIVLIVVPLGLLVVAVVALWS